MAQGSPPHPVSPSQPEALMAYFRSLAGRAAGEVSHRDHPMASVEPGTVGIDILRMGSDQAETVVFLTSGIHGAELWAGSVSQFDLITSGRLGRLPKGIAVVLIHAANPWGAMHFRRYTEENVDLCRNFVDFGILIHEPLPGYMELRKAFDAPPAHSGEADRFLKDYARNNGVPALYSAAMAGQYLDSDGIGFGGKAAAWARSTLESILTEHAGSARKVYLLDYHTGVGPYGYGSIIAMQTQDCLLRMRKVFGDWVIAPRDNPPPGFVDVTGHTTDGYEALFPGADVLAAVLEVGTYSQMLFLERLLAEHRLTRFHGAESSHPDLAAARRALIDFFIPQDPLWQAYLLHRSRQVFEQILEDATREQR